MIVPCLPRFWSVTNMFDTRSESDLENCDLEDQINVPRKWDGGHKRVGFFWLSDCAKENTFL